MKYNYTEKEKCSIINILRRIMEADLIIHPKEEEYMDKVISELNITYDVLSSYVPQDIAQSRYNIMAMSNNQKNEVKSLFETMAKIDGYVDAREITVIDEIFNAS